jgi:hypothetical protein
MGDVLKLIEEMYFLTLIQEDGTMEDIYVFEGRIEMGWQSIVDYTGVKIRNVLIIRNIKLKPDYQRQGILTDALDFIILHNLIDHIIIQNINTYAMEQFVQNSVFSGSKFIFNPYIEDEWIWSRSGDFKFIINNFY